MAAHTGLISRHPRSTERKDRGMPSKRAASDEAISRRRKTPKPARPKRATRTTTARSAIAPTSALAPTTVTDSASAAAAAAAANAGGAPATTKKGHAKRPKPAKLTE